MDTECAHRVHVEKDRTIDVENDAARKNRQKTNPNNHGNTTHNNNDTSSSNESSSQSSADSDVSEHPSEQLEPWHEWIRRSTRHIEEHTEKLGIDDWVHLARQRIYNWAGHISRRYDERWGSLLLEWMPDRGKRFNELGHGRKQARPKTRWEDCLSEYFAHASEDMHWRIMAADKNTWDQHLRAFSSFTD